MIYENIKRDMNLALKANNKFERLVLADMAAAIEKGATAGKVRVDITDQMAEDALIKYKKTVQEMIDTCPDTEQYAERHAEHATRMEIVKRYAPETIEDSATIENLIREIISNNNIEIDIKNKGKIMKVVMPELKQKRCDMKTAQEILTKLFN